MPRTRAFDEEALLDAAIELFWTRGYRAASLTDLSAETGVTNGSLYQAYGSKWALFLIAYRRYCAARVATVSEAVVDGSGGIEPTVMAFFDAIIDDCLSHPDRRGCLMLNTVSELGTDPEIARISTETVDAMETAVARAIASASPPTTTRAQIAGSAAHVVAVSQAMIQLSRMGRKAAELRRIGSVAARSTAGALQVA
jgi:TetR/AcrR family transcriptional repressor of nem operon